MEGCLSVLWILSGPVGAWWVYQDAVKSNKAAGEALGWAIFTFFAPVCSLPIYLITKASTVQATGASIFTETSSTGGSLVYPGARKAQDVGGINALPEPPVASQTRPRPVEDKKTKMIEPVKKKQKTIFDAIMSEDMGALGDLLGKGTDISGKNSDGLTPMLFAACNGRVKAAMFLLDHGASVTDQDKNGATALHWAAHGTHGDLVDMLVAKGAVLDDQDATGRTPLHWVALEGKGEMCVKLVSHGADINAQDFEGKTPLHVAVGQGRVDMAEVLLAGGADVNAKDYEGKSPIFKAALGDKKDAVEFLVGKGADINAKDNDGQTLLTAVVGAGKSEIADYLRVTGAWF
ncbi:MAG: ankyrin repeat domain-containing protein [Candidatus Eremiobacteraeota bacterium]|nr:ankyrin repeat domain-containing protein [Candidatus Eremiobacteraeota bacterium]